MPAVPYHLGGSRPPGGEMFVPPRDLNTCPIANQAVWQQLLDLYRHMPQVRFALDGYRNGFLSIEDCLASLSLALAQQLQQNEAVMIQMAERSSQPPIQVGPEAFGILQQRRTILEQRQGDEEEIPGD